MAYGSLWFIVMNSLCTATERKWYCSIGYNLTFFALIANAVLGFTMVSSEDSKIKWIAWILNTISPLLTEFIFLFKETEAYFSVVLFSLIILAAEGYLGYLYYLCKVVYLFIYQLACIISIILWNCIGKPKDIYLCLECCCSCLDNCYNMWYL